MIATMRRMVLISSTSALHFRISRMFANFSLSEDHKMLRLEQASQSIANPGMEIALLKEDNDNEIIAHITYPARIVDGVITVRIDSFFSLVFKEGENISNINAELLTQWECCKNLSKYSLFLSLQAPIAYMPARFAYWACPITSERIKFGSTTLPVSGELLCLHSDFFTSLFTGTYLERTQEAKEISEVSEAEFAQFVHWVHYRYYSQVSVNFLMYAIEYADRFMMDHAMRRALTQLTSLSCPEEYLEQALILADRVKSKSEIIKWLLSEFRSAESQLKTVHDVLPLISATTAQICIKALESVVTRTKPDYTNLSNLIPFEYKRRSLGAHLMFYDASRLNIVKEDYIIMEILESDAITPSGKIINLEGIWSIIPQEYCSMAIKELTDGIVTRTHTSLPFKGDAGRVIPFLVYREPEGNN